MTELNTELIAVSDAVQIASERGQRIPQETIIYNCRRGHIQGARIIGNNWVFTESAFLAWMDNRPKPGRK